MMPVNKLVREAGYNYKMMDGSRSPGKIDTPIELNKYNPFVNPECGWSGKWMQIIVSKLLSPVSGCFKVTESLLHSDSIGAI